MELPEFYDFNPAYVRFATLVPEFAMEHLPSGRIAALVPELAVKDLPLGRNTDDDDDIRF